MELKITRRNGETFVVVLDEEDVEMVRSVGSWSIKPTKGLFYAIHVKKEWAGDRRVSSSVYMHRMLLGCGPGQLVDHINGNGLDNRRGNLRIVNHVQNAMNRRVSRASQSGYKGVQLHKRSGLWFSYIHKNGRRISLGYFKTAEAAAAAYRAASVEIHREYARLA